VAYEWDPDKSRTNRRKHGIDFADAALVLEDPLGLTRTNRMQKVKSGSSPSVRTQVADCSSSFGRRVARTSG